MKKKDVVRPRLMSRRGALNKVMVNLLWLVGASALANFTPVVAAASPRCVMQPEHLAIRVPQKGFVWLEGEAGSGDCDNKKVPADQWSRWPSGTFDLMVHADGPSGSGRYWTITVGIASKQRARPVRGFCLTTTTEGWRTLQQYRRSPLPWLEDLDGDGKAELIIWDSFPLAEEQLFYGGFGLMAWVYRPVSDSSLTIDWVLSRRMAREIAEAYRSHPAGLGALAVQPLELFADQRCTTQAEGTR